MSKKRYIYSNQSSLWGDPELLGFGSDDFYIKEIDRKLANETIIKNHYSKKVYGGSFIHLGVFVDSDFKGVLQYGRLMHPASHGKFLPNTTIDSVLELNRMWLADGIGDYPESRAISYSIKYIKRKYPLTRVIQSFADERCGGFGIVYQACSFSYYGEHTTDFYELDGEVFHGMAMTMGREKVKGKRTATDKELYLQDNADRAIKYSLRQFRYLKFINNKDKKRCLMEEQPYPKHYNND